MRKLVFVPCLLALAALLARPAPAGPPPAVEPEARAILDRFVQAYGALRDMRYALDKRERMRDGDVVAESLHIKLRAKPYAVYVTRRDTGMEAIWRAGRNDGEMTVHPGSFPDITVNIDPEGSMAMDDQHHPIHTTGQAEIVRRIQQWLALAEEGKVTIRKLPDRPVRGQQAVAVEVDASRASGRRVAARDDETLFALARRVDSWPYLIYQHNPDVDDIDDELDEGDTVYVPASYAHRAVMAFDPATGLVVLEEYYDRAGLYESYVTRDRAVDVGLTERDFDPDNDAYDF